jgi:hypothetical protein
MEIKRFAILGFLAVFAASCTMNTAGLGGNPSGAWISDAYEGLKKLDHYRADLTRTVEMESADGIEIRSDRVTLAIWREAKAVFETIDSTDETGDRLELTAGLVDKAGYLLLGGDSGCQVYWDDQKIRVGENDPAAYLYPLKAGPAAGDETINGIAAHAFAVNSDSLGAEGVEAAGKVWIASEGGYLVKYRLELTGTKDPDGSGTAGKMVLDFEVSEAGDSVPVDYPGDCRPVLTDIPATDDAQAIERLPGRLVFDSQSPMEKIQSFYSDYFSGLEWDTANALIDETETERLLNYSSAAGREAWITLRFESGTTRVQVLTNDAPPAGGAPSADSTPGSGGMELPGARVVNSLAKLLGSGGQPGTLPSFALAVDEILPASSGRSITHVEAEIEGSNRHAIFTVDGKTTESYQIGEDYYEIKGGKAAPGSIMGSIAWDMWQIDLVTILSAAAMANPQAGPGITFEGRPVDVFTIGGESPGDLSAGLLPIVIGAIRGEVWIDHETGALLKADLTFEADVKQAGGADTAHGDGELRIAVSRIGKARVSLP